MTLRKLSAVSLFGLCLGLVADDIGAADAAAKKGKKAAAKKAAEETAKPADKPIRATSSAEIPRQALPAKAGSVKDVAKLIDAEIDKALAAAKLTPAGKGSDAEFLRRACLDIAGVIPTPERAATFLDANDPDKRAKLVDELLADEKFGHHLADVWGNLLFTPDSGTRFLTKAPLVKYLADSFNANKNWDKISADLLAGSGPQDKNPEVTYLASHRGVDKMADSVGRLFLGLQIQCAQCHNHPFTHWQQAEYWGFAQFFKQVNIVAPRNNMQKDVVPAAATRPPSRTGG